MFFLSKKKKETEDKMERILKNPKILEVNLIKSEIGLDFDWKKNSKGLVIALVVAGLIIFELYTGLDWWQKDEEKRLEKLKTKISEQSKEVNDFRKSADEALSYKDKTVEVGNLLNNHIYWTNFFSWLEKNTLSTVSYNGFSGKLDGKYSLNGTASSYADVAWQVKTLLESPITLKAAVNSVNSSGNKTKAEIAAEAIAAEAAKKEAALKEPTAEGSVDKTTKEQAPADPSVSFTLALELKPEIFKK
ncbi:MAG: hypothetical protein WCT50_04765 [Patescibacteria group bacterium]